MNLIKERNYEIAMRLNTNIKNDNTMYTDLNGFNMIKRITYSKLPLQANYYPIPTQAYIEDSTARMTILSRYIFIALSNFNLWYKL